MYVFICLMYCINLSENLLPKKSRASGKQCVIIVLRCGHLSGQRFLPSLVCTVADSLYLFKFSYIWHFSAGAAVFR